MVQHHTWWERVEMICPVSFSLCDIASLCKLPPTEALLIRSPHHSAQYIFRHFQAVRPVTFTLWIWVLKVRVEHELLD